MDVGSKEAVTESSHLAPLLGRDGRDGFHGGPHLALSKARGFKKGCEQATTGSRPGLAAAVHAAAVPVPPWLGLVRMSSKLRTILASSL